MRTTYVAQRVSLLSSTGAVSWPSRMAPKVLFNAPAAGTAINLVTDTTMVAHLSYCALRVIRFHRDKSCLAADAGYYFCLAADACIHKYIL